MKVAIIGSRSINEYQWLLNAVEESGFRITEVVSGGAVGIDSLAERFAKESDLPFKLFPPDYEKHGKAAPHVRNSEIAKYCDAMIAVWDGNSAGSKSMMSKVTSLAKPVFVYTGPGSENVHFDWSWLALVVRLPSGSWALYRGDKEEKAKRVCFELTSQDSALGTDITLDRLDELANQEFARKFAANSEEADHEY